MPAKPITSALIAFLVGTPLAAQDPVAQEPDSDEIVVTGRGLEDTPASPAYGTVIIDREGLLATGSGRLEDSLRSVAGFQQFRRSDSRSANPTAQGVTLRALGGNAASRALVLLDGVPMTDPFFGHVPLAALAPERLGEARVTRGGGSGPFGAGALAGVVDLTSASRSDLSAFEGSALINDRAETELSASLAPALGAGFATLSGRWDRGRGFWTTPLSQRVAASVPAAYESWSAQLRGVAPLGATGELQARVLAFRDRRVLRFAGAENTTEGEDASLRFVGRGQWQVDALIYLQRRDFSNIVVSATRFVPTLNQRKTPATGLGGKIELRPPIDTEHVLRIGLDYRRAVGRAEEDALSATTGAVTERRIAGGTTDDFGLFIEDDWSTGAFTLTAGVRADRTSISNGVVASRLPSGAPVALARYPDQRDWNVSFRGGALFEVSNRLSMRAAAYTGLRVPTLNELYRSFVVFPVTTQANAQLSAERLEGYELGAEWQLRDVITLGMTAFDNRVRGAIANVTVGQNLRQRRNIDAIVSRGIEASVRGDWGSFGLDASVAYTDAEMKGGIDAPALTGRRPAQTPRLAASGTVSWRPARDWLLSLTARHVGAQFEDDLGSDVLPPATTFDGYARIPLSGGAALVLRAENVLDADVVTRNQGSSIDLGVPRTVWVGVSFGH